MKRVLAWVLVLTLCLGLFAGCKKKDKTETPSTNNDVVSSAADLQAALEYIKTVYKKVGEKTPKDFQRIGNVPVNGKNYEVVWSADVGEEFVKVVKGTDGMVTIDVKEDVEAEVKYVLTATISDEAGNSVSHAWNHLIPTAGNMAAIVEEAYLLEPGASMGYEVTLTGKITAVNTPWDPSYKNITVTIIVEGAEDKPIMCYRLKGEGADKLKPNDIITVTGTIKNYNGTIEFDAGCTLDAMIVGEEIKAPTDPKQIIKEAYELAQGGSLPYKATLTGVITKVNTEYNPSYKNVTVTMVVDGDNAHPIQCYRLAGDGADKIDKGDTITVTGWLTNYKGTVQFGQGCTLDSWKDTGANTPKPEDTFSTTLVPEIVSDPQAGVAYKFFMYQKNRDKNLYLTGNMNGYYYETTYDPAKAVDVYLEEVSGGWRAYFMKDGVKNYLEMVVSGTHKNVIFVTTPTKALKWNAEAKTLTCDLTYEGVNKDYYWGTYSNYNTFSASDIARVTGANADLESNFVSHLAIMKETKVSAEEKAFEALKNDYAVESTDPAVTEENYTRKNVYEVDGTKVNVVWTENSDAVEIVDNGDGTVTVKVTRGTADAEYTLTATITDGDKTYTTSWKCVVPAMPKEPTPPEEGEETDSLFVPKPVEVATVGVAYKYYMYQATKDVNLFFDGTVSGGYLGTTEDMAAAVDVYVEAVEGVEGAVRFYFMDGETKTYIEIFKNSSNKIRQQLVTEATMYYTYNAEAKTYVTEIGSDTYYPGTYDSYTTIGASKISYITGSNADKVGVTQYIAKFATLAPAAETVEPADAPVAAGKAFKYYMYQATKGVNLFFDGTVSGGYLGTTEDMAAAVDVYVETVEGVEGAVRFYFMDGETKTYIEIFKNSSNKIRQQLVTEATMYYTYNAEAKTYVTEIGSDTYYPGTYDNYTTIGASKISYITGSNADKVGVTQYIAQFGSVVVKEVAPAVSEPAVEGTAYMYYMYQATKGVNLFFDGTVSGGYLGTTEDMAAAVDVYVEAVEGVEGAVRFYFMDGETKTYIEIFKNSSNKIRQQLVTEATMYYTYNAEAKTYVTEIGSDTYYPGTYDNYTTIGASKISYITGSNADKVGVTQYIAHLATLQFVEDEDEAEPAPDPEPDPEPDVEAPATLAEQIAQANQLANGAYLSYESTITGTITDSPVLSSRDADSYKFTVSDGTNSLLCYYVPVTGGTPVQGSTVTVTGRLTAYNGSAQFDSTAAAVLSGNVAPAPTPTPDTAVYTKIDRIANLAAGSYKVAAYCESYVNGNTNANFTNNPYHLTVGSVDGGDLTTTAYAFSDGTLTKGAAGGTDAASVELVAVAGKANTYYVKMGEKYLVSDPAQGLNSRKLILSDTAIEWVAEDFANGGIILNQIAGDGFVTLGSAGASSKLIRCYKSSEGVVNTGIKFGLYFFAANS